MAGYLDHDVQRGKVCPSLSKKVSNDPFDAITFMGFGNPAFADDHAQPGALHVVGNRGQAYRSNAVA